MALCKSYFSDCEEHRKYEFHRIILDALRLTILILAHSDLINVQRHIHHLSEGKKD
jgi:hypothetical protein